VDEVGEAATVADAMRDTLDRPAQLTVMDVSLPDGDGVDATRRIMQARPDAKVLMVTMSDDEEVVNRSLQAGARGYVLKDTDPDIVVDALRTVAGGGLVLGPRIGTTLLAGPRRPAGPPAPFDRLTDRERDIVARLARGESNVRIARHLGLSEKTVRNQMSAVFAKLGVSDRVQAALLARDTGFAQ
jgi:DNA-binding NarL/FixJ family response regulator